MRRHGNRFTAFLILLSAIFAAPLAGAQGYPAKVVRIIVPFPPGSGGDTLTRLFTAKLTDAFGQQFAVDNRVGAAGNIGAEQAARSAPDGYTLLMAASSAAISQNLYKNLTFDLARDFEPVAMLAFAPVVLVVHPSLPVRDVKQFIALAKSRPGVMNYGSAGIGSAPHLSAELFKMQAQVNLVHVPYKGTPQVVTDLIGGQVEALFGAAVSVLPHIKSNRVHALAIASAKRSNTLPELPTFTESGLPGYEAASWFTLLAPAGTPQDIIGRVNAAVVRIGESPEMRTRVAAEVSEFVSATPEQTGTFIKGELAKWGKVIAAANVRAE